MRRWLTRIALGLVALLVAGMIVGAVTERELRARTAARFPAPGRLVDIGERRLHLDCRGAGAPTVVLEAGLDVYGSLSWASVHDSLAATTRTCAYSRAGIMWSDARGDAFDARGVARDLHAALQAAGEQPPFVVVGHSLGGPYILTFTGLFPADVAGLVFVDASHPDQINRLRDAVGADLEPPLAPARAAAALAWTGLARLIPTGDPRTMPPRASATARGYFATGLGAMVDEISALHATLDTAGHYRQLGARPAVFLTANAPTTAEDLAAAKLTAEQGARMQAAWRALQADEATWSTRSRHELVPDATHYIQFDRPDVVIRAVREVVGAVRAPAP